MADNTPPGAKVGFEFSEKVMADLSEMREYGAYKDLGEVIGAALALKLMVDRAHQKGFTTLLCQNPAGIQQRMHYTP